MESLQELPKKPSLEYIQNMSALLWGRAVLPSINIMTCKFKLLSYSNTEGQSENWALEWQEAESFSTIKVKGDKWFSGIRKKLNGDS